jgi:hypothetical protein
MAGSARTEVSVRLASGVAAEIVTVEFNQVEGGAIQ